MGKDISITLTVDVTQLHKDPSNALKYINLSDNLKDDYDDKNNKSTFDTIADSNTLVAWNAQDMGTGNLVIITDLKFVNVPDGFFSKEPYQLGDDSWVAILGDNQTDKNMVCEYTIIFDDGVEGDQEFPIDPKLQIKRKNSIPPPNS